MFKAKRKAYYIYNSYISYANKCKVLATHNDEIQIVDLSHYNKEARTVTVWVSINNVVFATCSDEALEKYKSADLVRRLDIAVKSLGGDVCKLRRELSELKKENNDFNNHSS